MKNNAQSLRQLKANSEKFSVLALYDATMARLAADAGINALLVGDSLGMVVQGCDSTIPVTIDEIAYHTSAVRNGVTQSDNSPLIIADMPFMSYQNPDIAMDNAAELMRAGANMVKMEGGSWLCETVSELIQNGVPVCAHLGLTPQSVNVFGGYKAQGKTDEAKQQLLDDTKLLEQAGASFIVYECIPAQLAAAATASTSMGTIGIGAGAQTDAQVLVAYDMLGMAQRPARFVKNFLADTAANAGNPVFDAFIAYDQAVKSSTFPTAGHQYD